MVFFMVSGLLVAAKTLSNKSSTCADHLAVSPVYNGEKRGKSTLPIPMYACAFSVPVLKIAVVSLSDSCSAPVKILFRCCMVICFGSVSTPFMSVRVPIFPDRSKYIVTEN